MKIGAMILAAAILAAPCGTWADEGPGAPGPNENAGATRVISSLYAQLLHREPDSAGFAYWAADASELRSVAIAFAASDELLKEQPDSRTWLTKTLYGGLLGREPDADGLRYWLGRLDEGASREQVAASFARSQECLGKPQGGACASLLRPELAESGFAVAPETAPAGLGFAGLRGANLQEMPAGAMTELLQTAAGLHVNAYRVRVPLNLAANGVASAGRLAEETLAILDQARDTQARVLLVLDGYKGYDEPCGDKASFTDVREAAQTVVDAAKGHPALLGWDLQSDPLSDRRGCKHATVIQAVVEMYRLVRAADPRAATTVGEAYPAYQSTWNLFSSFASPHLYFSGKSDLEAGLERVTKEVSPLPVIVGEFGFDAPGQVSEEEQAKLYALAYLTLRKKDVGSMFWLLAQREEPLAFSVVRADGSSRPAAMAISQAFSNESPVASQLYGFASDNKALCEASVIGRLGGEAECTIGGGCGSWCGKPGAGCESANPTLYGACLSPSDVVARR
ncbi:MAG: DUF4214 domain-containing protein [Elusimicrobia bacterium]|nr:DUF4214 domain-containing protein [Elusimicrobiota bacterium]